MRSGKNVVRIIFSMAFFVLALWGEGCCGGEFWYVFAPFNGNLSESFQVAQEKVLNNGNYNDPTKPVIIENKEEFMRMFNLNNKQFDDMIKKDRKQSLYAKEIFEKAKTKEEKINALRQLTGNDGTRSILDMAGIKPHPEICYLSPITSNELMRIFGTEKPMKSQVQEKLSDIAELCDRMIGKYVVVYDKDKRIEVLFAGYSAD